jgi:hypothetical protein
MKPPPFPPTTTLAPPTKAPTKRKKVKEEMFLEVGRVGWVGGSYFNLFGIHLGRK